MDLIVTNGTIVTAVDTFDADIGIEDGTIVEISRTITPASHMRVIDAAGRLVFPGGVDTHTHLDSPNQGTVTADDFVSGTIAAACGGTTSIVDFCFQTRGGSLADALTEWHDRAEGKAVIDYGFHIVVVDMNDAVYDELARLPSDGVTSFKVFMAYKGASMVDDWTIMRTLEQAKACGALVLVHAENGDAAYILQRKLLSEGKTQPKYHAVSRPPRVEAEATARVIALAEIVGTSVFIVHVSCGEALDEIIRGRARGVDVLAETCPQYLFTCEHDLDRPGFEGAKFVFTPPPRQETQHNVLWRALATAALQSVGSDHCAFNYAGQKDLGITDFTKIPNGAPGIEERLMAIYQGVNEGRLTLNRFVDLVATSPARMFGLYPEKGTIMIGSDADLVVWNPDAELTLTRAALHHRVDYTLYEGMRMRGIPETVLLRGEVIVQNREHTGGQGGGRFIRRKRFGAR